MKQDFKAAEKRMAALRLQVQEFLRSAGINKVRYWRAVNGKVSRDAQVATLRLVEAALDRMETPCSLCGEVADKSCGDFGCPIDKRTNA